MSDSMFTPTGLGRVARAFVLGLMSHGHQVSHIGWFQRIGLSEPIPKGLVYWGTNDVHYGSKVLDDIVRQAAPEIVITIGDLWNVAYIADQNLCRMRRHFQWCHYIPVDGEPIRGGIPKNLMSVLEDIDIPVAYTNYAKNSVLKSSADPELRMRIKVIYHGVDTDVFHPLAWDERKRLREAFGVDDKFMFLTVCRNQSRKNIPEMFLAWREFSRMEETRDKVVWWPHTNFTDRAGWNLRDMIDEFDMKDRTIMYYNEVAFGQSEAMDIPDKELAKLYQIADAFLLVSGEGFGLPIIEAMACRVPCVILDCAAGAELGSNGRAALIPPGNCSVTGMYFTQRFIPRTEDISDAMLKIYRDKSYRDETAQKGYEFAVNHKWEKVISEWNHLIFRQEIPFIQPIEMEVCA